MERHPATSRWPRVMATCSMLAVLIAGSSRTTYANPLACKSAIVRAGADFAIAKLKALQKCDEGVAKGKLVGPCPDAIGAAKIDVAATKLRARINRACGGADQTCGTGDDDSLASLGWPATCPDLEGVGCTLAIANCTDIEDCLLCVNEWAVDQSLALYYADLELELPIEGVKPSSADRALTKCQLAIGRAATKFYVVKSKALAKCWDAVVTGTIVGPCPDPKAAALIAKAESKKASGICKACGGADSVCGGGDDLTPEQIGFVTRCPAVGPNGSCGAPVTTLADLVTCVDCVTEFKVDCATTLSVPQLSAYPSDCNPDPTPANPGLDACEGFNIDHCEEATLDGNGYEFSNVVLPAGADEVTFEDVDQDLGPVSALYPCDTTLNTWYGDDCAQQYLRCCPATIGGYFPEPITEPDLTTIGVSAPPDDAATELASDEAQLASAYKNQGFGQPGPPISTPPCGDPICQYCANATSTQCVTDADCGMNGPCLAAPCSTLQNPSSVFQGRDIIYVHGLDPYPLLDKINHVPGALTTWPANPAAFIQSGGYWRARAEYYWAPHIINYLNTRNATNRYLEVAWASTQRLPFAVHAVLSQIVDAMTSGTNVQLLDPDDPRGTHGFCSGGCVVVSHSAGAPVTDVALALAELTKTSAIIRKRLGDIGCVADSVKAHVAFDGAFGGSEYATGIVAVTGVIGVPLQTTATLATQAFQTLTGASVTVPDLASLLDSVLVDLVPLITRLHWIPLMRKTPVPVLTVAGGHDKYPNFALKWLMLRGFDDGVLPMDSTCAKGAFPLGWPTGFIASPALVPAPLNPRLYDLGMALKVDGGQVSRATKYFLEQNVGPLRLPPRAAAACIPYKTSWGLVQPVATPLFGWWNPLKRIRRHYSFVDTAEDHINDQEGVEYDSATGSITRREETRTMSSSAPFTLGLVKPSIVSKDRQQVLGKKITFKLFGKKHTWWIWKRTYDRLEGFETRLGGDWVYDYILAP